MSVRSSTLLVNDPTKQAIDAMIKSCLLNEIGELEVRVAINEGVKRLDIMRLTAFFENNDFKSESNDFMLDIFFQQEELGETYRISLLGDKDIMDYCSGQVKLKVIGSRDVIAGKKAAIQVMNKVHISNKMLPVYDSKINYNHENIIDRNKDLRTYNQVLAKADSTFTAKKYRLKSRRTFLQKGSDWKVDITQIKTNGSFTKAPLSESGLSNAPILTEIEVELITKLTETDPTVNDIVLRCQKNLATILYNIVRNLRRSPILIEPTDMVTTLNAYVQMIHGYTTTPIKTKTDFTADMYLNKKPKGLVYNNISEPQTGSLLPNLFKNGPYAATFKADGENCQLYIDAKGNINLIYDTRNIARLPGTSKVTNVICSAELVEPNMHIRVDEAATNSMSIPQLLIYEIYYQDGVPVWHLPLQERMGRYQDVAEGIDGCTTHSITAKKHFFCDENDSSLLYEAVKTLEETRPNLTFEIDGIIFTKMKDTYGKPLTSKSSAVNIYKWKPMDLNSVDARIVFEEGWEGKVGPFNATLSVGYNFNKDVSDDVLSKVFLHEKQRAAYGEKLLANIQCIRNAHTSNISLYVDEPHYRRVDISIPESDLRLSNDTIVECRFEQYVHINPSTPVDSKYKYMVVPFRHREDKTETLRKTGISGAVNDYSTTVVPILESIKTPVSLADLMANKRPTYDDSVDDDTYYENNSVTKVNNNEAYNLMRDYNNRVKSEIYEHLFKAGEAVTQNADKRPNLLDIGCGRGGDIHKYPKIGYTSVLGIDYSFNNIYVLKDENTYHRFANMKRGVEDLDYVFLSMDATKDWSLSNKDLLRKPSIISIISGKDTPNDKFNNEMITNLLDPTYNLPIEYPEKLRRWNGMLQNEDNYQGRFDTMSCMFVFHFLMGSKEALHTAVKNISKNLKVGGVFVATLLDGRAVESALELAPKNVLTDSPTNPSRTLKKVGDWTLSNNPTENYGKEIAVFMSSISTKANKEPIVDIRLMDQVFESYGLDRVTDIPQLNCTLYSGFAESLTSYDGGHQFDYMHTKDPTLTAYIDLHRVVAYRKLRG